MAQIYPVNYQQNGYNPGDQLVGIAAGAQKAPPIGEYQAQQAQAQDPLFEALARYITSGPGASSVSTKNIEDIIAMHSGDSGRDYLQSIVQPQYGDALRVWEHSAKAKGHVYTNLTDLSLVLSATSDGVGVPYLYGFNGKAKGFFAIGQFIPIDGQLFYDGDLKSHATCSYAVEYNADALQIKIKFFDEVRVQPVPGPKPWAELVVDLFSISLPGRPILPPSTQGQGAWTVDAQ